MTPEEFDELEVTEINDFTQISAITGDENFHVQTPAGNNLACMISQIAGYAFPATCNSAAAAATKVVVITGYHGTVLPQLVAVTFTNGNTYGDVTASPATHPYIQFKNADNVNLGNARDLCDCRGNYAGTGCIKAGNIIYLSTIGTKTLMINHDIRQQTDTMTIKADGSKEYATPLHYNRYRFYEGALAGYNVWHRICTTENSRVNAITIVLALDTVYNNSLPQSVLLSINVAYNRATISKLNQESATQKVIGAVRVGYDSNSKLHIDVKSSLSMTYPNSLHAQLLSYLCDLTAMTEVEENPDGYTKLAELTL